MTKEIYIALSGLTFRKLSDGHEIYSKGELGRLFSEISGKMVKVIASDNINGSRVFMASDLQFCRS